MKKQLLFSGLAVMAGLTLGSFALPSTTAEAKIHYTTTPKSFRGTWVNFFKEDIGGTMYRYRSTAKITKYVYNYKYVVNGRTISKVNWSGKKKSFFYKHSNLGVKKGKNGRWRISQYGMKNNIFNTTYKRVKHNGKQALVSLDHYEDGTPLNFYYYKK